MWRSIAFFVLALAFAPAASAQSFNAQEQAEIRAVVRDYLVRNPEKLTRVSRLSSAGSSPSA